MPFINTKLTCPLSTEKENLLREKFGQAITLIGKSENWLMLGFEDNCRLAFRGQSDAPLAFVEVKLYGSASKVSYENFTRSISNILEDELNIPKDGIYVKYEEVNTWGYNGSNF